MTSHKKPPQAYRNSDFLTSPRARALRILSEYMEPESRFRHYEVEDTIVFYGSARIVSREEAEARLKNAQEEGEDTDRPEKMLAMPAHFFIRFFHNHGMLNIKDRPVWRVIRGGSRNYVEKLVEGHRHRIRLRSPVRAVRRCATHVEITTDDAGVEHFDQVFIACHSNQALAMLEDASPQEREVLGAIPYQTNEAVLHTDDRLMPKRRIAWGAWNYHILGGPQERVALTYNMNILQTLKAPVQFCVTLNNSEAINPHKILGRFNYAHPVFSLPGIKAQQRWEEINGVQHTWFCGAYWHNGFHEDGLVSGLRVAEALADAGSLAA